MPKNRISLFFVFAILLLFVVSIWYLTKNTASDANKINSSSAASTPDALENQQLASEVRNKYADFPIIYGDTSERKVADKGNSLIIESTIKDELSNVVFWHYDEFVEDGFTIEIEPDIENNQSQSLSAFKDNIRAILSANRVAENETSVIITLTKYE